jgi:tetratricopeptide (TPR) repeat protein
MKAERPTSKRILVIVQTLLLLAGSQPACLAGQDSSGTLSYAELGTLSDCEKKIYGGAHTSLPSDKRVEALENEVFGEVKKGSLSARVASLHSTMAANTPSLLAPPLAAKMDNSAQQTTAPTSVSGRTGTSGAGADQTSSDDLPPVAPPIDHAKSALHQALTLYSQGKIKDAEIAFKRVLAIDHDNTDANFNLGAIAEGRGDLESALKHYNAVLRVNPDDNDARTAANSIQQKLASAPATAQLPPPNQAPQPSRDILRERVGQASAAFKRGDYDGSIRILQSVAQEAPNEPDIQYALAQSYKGKGEYMAARTALNQAIALAPDNQMYQDALRDLNRNIANGGALSSGATDTLADNNGANGSSNEPAGKITPFTGVGSPSVGWQPTGPGDAYAAGGQYYPAYANRYSNRSTTSRIERAAIGGLAGAAVGALFGGAMSGYGGRGRGAMMGAGMGGLFGLMFGAR